MTGEVTHEIFKHNHQKANLASFRLQLYPALATFKELGHKIEVWSLHNKNAEHIELLDCDVCIIGKMSAQSEEKIKGFSMINLAAIARLKRKGAHIAMIYSDNHYFKEDILGEFYKDSINMVDTIICPTQKLINFLQPAVDQHITFKLIKDPWHFNSMNDFLVRQSKNEAVKILWFGSHSNILYLTNILEKLLNNKFKAFRIKLTILCSKAGNEAVQRMIDKSKNKSQEMEVFYKLWESKLQPEQLRNELANAHLALLPSDPSDTSKAGVSHNRFVDAVRGGAIPIASPIDSYQELEQLGLIGNDFVAMIQHAVKNYDELVATISQNRKYILKEFSPHTNSLKWKEWLESICED